MDQQLGVMGTPGVGFFMLLIIGGIAGWIAEKVTKSDHGLLTNILVGIAGSFVGTQLAGLLNISVSGFLVRLLVASAGAILVLWGWQALQKSRQGN